MQNVFSWYIAQLQTKAFPQEPEDLVSPSFLQALSARVVEFTALNRETLDSVQAVTSKPLNVFCLALQPLKSVAVVLFTSVEMFLCQRDTLHQTQ